MAERKPPPPPTPTDIERGKRFKEARVGSQHTQESLARLLGVDKSTVGRWEAGIIVPERDTRLEEFARITGRSKQWLLFGSEESSAIALRRYPAWDEFKRWLEQAPERSLAEQWMLDDLERWPFGEGREPTVETYKQMLRALFDVRKQ